jgi:hypothetical protein
MSRDLQLELRFLRTYAVVTSTIAMVLALGAFSRSRQRPHFDELDVERINVVEKDGTTRMVISNAERAPGWIAHGRTFPGRPKLAGMIFYNDEGEEDGGLIFNGRSSHDTVNAGASLTFDQYAQDQVVALQYSDYNGRQRYGLGINEFTRRPTLEQLMQLGAMPDGAAKRAAKAHIDSIVAANGNRYGSPRAFLGREQSGDATVALADQHGHTRLRIVVDTAGAAHIDFLDAHGKVTKSISESTVSTTRR